MGGGVPSTAEQIRFLEKALKSNLRSAVKLEQAEDHRRQRPDLIKR